ncbi:ATP-binding protein [Desulfuromonas sp. AOP6]|uniref:ATP-binding protein n=1 Tax=Desulfuromonas sp. AOP6 TaxID=1566351 RepID=UPI001288D59A|nr:ATP-binding protein [Desulfuromonas sp. AOP6]BCA80849.1 two-component sensor histidine kinase [Desulfuromonas sp. AOP6]
MHKLFIKIFLWFWLAMTLVGAFGIVMALTSDPFRLDVERKREAIRALGLELVEALEQGGQNGLLAKSAELRQKSGRQLFLLRGEGISVGGERLPPRVRNLALIAAQTGEIQVQPGKKGVWVALPDIGDYTLLAHSAPPSRLERLLNPYHLAPRLLATFLITGVICYLLARSLTAPIEKLRLATRKIAAGDFSTRVRAEVPGQNELADLADDFDRMTERVETLVDAQKRLLRDISHELRSPLARLHIALELVRQKSGPEATSPLDRIGREAERLNELIGQLLALTQSERVLPKSERVPIDLRDLVLEIAADADFEARGHSRSVRATATQPLHTAGNPEILRRAIENVVRNAIRHTVENSAVEIDLQQEVDDDVHTAVITIRDHGAGLAEQDLTRIFEPFYRVSDARDRQSGGTGIGLAIAERAVRLHNGSVTAANAQGGGLLVTIRLPLDAGEEG